ncbi:MAG: ABC transporter permease [Proteobacteria bacterium]|nr:MAG: ABC transporter permease [Pseudomonadota bacterium]
MRRYLPSALIFLLALIVWELLAAGSRAAFLLGVPSAVWRVLWRATIDGTLPSHAMTTGLEALSGFLIGAGAGTVTGFLLWYSPGVARISKPYVFVLSIVPSFSFAPIIIIWFGIGFGMKVAMAALATFVVALSQAYEGCRNIEPQMFQLLRIMGASRRQVLRIVVLPASLAWVFNSLRLNVGVALLGAFIGEFISSDRGVGYFMIRAGSLYDVPGVWAGAIYLLLLAVILNLGVAVLERQKLQIARAVSVSRSRGNFSSL